MAISQPIILAFNRGLISQLALARTDLKRMALSASIQTNLMPRMLGSAMVRPGMRYIGSTLSNQVSKTIPFVFSTTDVALLEMTDSNMRVWLPGADGTPTSLLTRASVASTVANGTFTGSLASWTNADQAGALSSWVSNGVVKFVGTGFNEAREWQKITVAGGDLNKEHAVRVVVSLGVIVLNIGTTAGSGEYASALSLGVGTHSISFTPTGDFYIQLSNGSQTTAYVASVAIEAAGVVTLPTAWTAAKLPYLRWDQSASVVYVACDGVARYKIQRWSTRSWSMTRYQPLDGPFLTENVGSITLTPSDVTGLITLTASGAMFKPEHATSQSLFRLASVGQEATVSAAGINQWSGAVQAKGLASGSGRAIAITITGTFNATVQLQRSVGAVGAWEDVPGQSWTTTGVRSYNDGLDNQIIFYRIGIEGTYVSGTAVATLIISTGSITGICRVVGYTSPTVVSASVIIQPGNTGVLAGLGSVTATLDWWEEAFSDVQGQPTSVCIHEGRLWWAGRDRIVGSVSDAYESFDDTQVGDSGPLNRTIGSGPVDVVNWLLPLADLIVGTQGAEKSVRSANLGGIVTPTDFIMKDASTQGGSPVPGVKIDYNGVFLQRSGRRVYMLTYTPSFFLMDYTASDLTNFVPDIAIMENGAPLSSGGFNWLCVQRQPDTRIHGLLNDGTVRVLILDPTEEEHCWIKVQTDGVVEDCFVLPGQGGATSSEDLVYYTVRRTVNGATVRYHELWAREDECIGATVSKCADSHVVFSQAPSTTISGLSHLVGKSVVVWADGADQGGPFTVSGGGTITLNNPVSAGCVGLGYTMQFQSTKLAYAAQLGTPIGQKKRVPRIALVLANASNNSIQYGPDFTTMYDMPTTYKGAPVASTAVYASYDDESFAFPGTWDTDSRICLQAQAPRPAVVMAIVVDMETSEHV